MVFSLSVMRNGRSSIHAWVDPEEPRLAERHDAKRKAQRASLGPRDPVVGRHENGAGQLVCEAVMAHRGEVRDCRWLHEFHRNEELVDCGFADEEDSGMTANRPGLIRWIHPLVSRRPTNCRACFALRRPRSPRTSANEKLPWCPTRERIRASSLPSAWRVIVRTSFVICTAYIRCTKYMIPRLIATSGAG